MSKKAKKIIFSIALVILFCFIFCIPSNSLRFTLLFHNPYKAITTDLVDKTHVYKTTDNLDSSTIIYELSNPPIDAPTQGILYTWKVKKYGIFYIASYKGET